MKIVWAPLAERRAAEAFDYIAAENPEAAREWLTELLSHVHDLDQFPNRGRKVPAIARPNYREIMHPPYRVIYRVDRAQVEILTLRHQSRAWEADGV